MDKNGPSKSKNNNFQWLNDLTNIQKEVISALYDRWFTPPTAKYHTFRFISKTIFENQSVASASEAIRHLKSLTNNDILSLNLKLGNTIVLASDIESTGLEFGKTGRPSFSRSNPQDYRKLKSNSERFGIAESELESVYNNSVGKIDRMTEFASVFYIRNVDGEVHPAASNESDHISFHRYINPGLSNKVPEKQRIDIDIDDVEAQQVTGHTKSFLEGKETHSTWGNKIDPAISLETFVAEFDEAMSFSKTAPSSVFSIYHNGDNFDTPFLDEELSREVPGRKLRDYSVVIDSIPLFRQQVPTPQLKLFSKLQLDVSYGGTPALKENVDVAISPKSRSLDNMIKFAKFITNTDFSTVRKYLTEEEAAMLPQTPVSKLRSLNPALETAIKRLNETSRDIHGAMVDSMLLGDALIAIESILYPANKRLSMDEAHKRDNQNKKIHPYQPIIKTEYSITGAFGKPEDYVSRFAEVSKDIDDPSMILADRLTTAGKVGFFKACEKHGIRPILGMTIDLKTKIQSEPKSVVLVANNKAGEINLNRIGSIAFDTKQGGYEVVDIDSLTPELSEGLTLVATDNIDGLLLSDNVQAAEVELRQLKDIFGDNIFMSVSRVADERESELMESELLLKKKTLSSKIKIPLYADNKVSFPSADNYKAQKALDKILSKELLYAPHQKSKTSVFQYLPSPEQMLSKFSDNPEFLQSPIEHFKDSRLDLELGNPELPDYTVPKGFDSEMSYLRSLTEKGFETRWPVIESHLKQLKADNKLESYVERVSEENGWDFDKTKPILESIKSAYLDRINYEMKVVESTGFPGYFLITHDYVNWAKNNDVPIGPGRGSGAGSLVLYSLNITDPDPIERGLLFERFLNPERVGMPDVDVDVSQKKRDKVIEYFIDKYGADYVSQIQTYNTLAAKASIDATGRILSYKPYEREAIRKLIDDVPGVTLSDEIAENESLKMLINDESKSMVQEHISLSMSTEGSISGKGRHAGGIVVFKKPIVNYGSTFKPEDDQGSSTIQFDKDDVELLGGVKNDLLGLKNLDIIQMTEDKTGVDPKELSESRYFEDKVALEMLGEAETFGVFQLESPGMKRLLKQIGVTSFDDIVAVLALYRPGPLSSGMNTDYINRKNGVEEIEYPHEKLEYLLKSTYGTIIYQEQVMGIARTLAGYSLGQADILRKAMGKKIPEVMEKQRKQFVTGAMRLSQPDVLKATEDKSGVAKDVCLSDIKIKELQSVLSNDGYFTDGDSVANFLFDFGIVDDGAKNKLISEFAENNDDDGNKKDKKDKADKFDHAAFYIKYGKTFADRINNKLRSDPTIENPELLSERIVIAASNVARYNQIFNLMAEFAAYGFNKSHSEAYAMISMKTAYLKSHYPATYMASVATHDKDLESVSKTILESKRMGLSVLPPDINKSVMEFDNTSTKKQNELRIGFGKLHGINDPIKYIFNEREEVGEYDSILSFYARLANNKIKTTNIVTGKVSQKKVLTPTTMKSLISAGLFDSLMVGDRLKNREMIRKTLPLFPLLAEKSVKDNPVLNKLIRNSIAILTHPMEKITDKELQRVQGEYLKIKDDKFSKKISDALYTLMELFEDCGQLTVSKLKSIRTDVEVDKKQAAKVEYELTGTYVSSHYLEASGVSGYLKTQGYRESTSEIFEQMDDLAEGKPRGKEYVNTRLMGTIVDKKVFYGISPRHDEPRHSVSLTIDDGSGILCQVFFDAEDMFDYGKIDSGLNKLTIGEGYGFSGSACRDLYDSAPLRLYAKGIDSEIKLPLMKKSKSKYKKQSYAKKSYPATEKQVDFVKSLLGQKGISEDDFLDDNGINSMSDVTFEQATAFINNNIKKSNGAAR